MDAEVLRQARRNVRRRMVLMLASVVAVQVATLALVKGVADSDAWPNPLTFVAPYLGLAVGYRRQLANPRPYDLLDADGRRQVRQAIWRGRPPAAHCRPALAAALRPLPWLLVLFGLVGAMMAGFLVTAEPRGRELLVGAVALWAVGTGAVGWNLAMGRAAASRVA